MEQDFINYIKFVNGLDVLFVSKHNWVTFFLTFLWVMLFLFVLDLFIVKYVNLLISKQKAIEYDIAGKIEEKENSIKNLKKYRKKSLLFLIISISVFISGVYFADKIKDYKVHEITLLAKEKRMLENKYFKQSLEGIEKYNSLYFDKSDLILFIKDYDVYNQLIRELNEKFYLNHQLTEEEQELKKALEELNGVSENKSSDSLTGQEKK